MKLSRLPDIISALPWSIEFIFVHSLIVIPLLIPCFVCLMVAKKKKKKSILILAFPLLFLPVVPYMGNSIHGYKITNECYVKKHLLKNEYYLSNKKGKKLVEGVFEWCITDNYIYGFDGYESPDAKGFIYNRITETGEKLDYFEFVIECEKLGLEHPTCVDNIYTLRDCLPRTYPLDDS